MHFTPADLDKRYEKLAEILHRNHMSELGIRPTMTLAGAYNYCKYFQEKG